MNELTLVSGSTGVVGGKICDLLVSQGRAVRALVRPSTDPAKVERLRTLGAEVVVGDVEQPETLGPAMAGVTHVVTTASTFPADQRPDAIDLVERGGTCNLVDAAAAAGVRRFVHLSLLETPTTYPHQQAKLAAEAYVKQSGLEYAAIKPGLFVDVWFSQPLGFDVAGGTIQLFGDGTATHTWICTDDVARFCVWALDAPEARNAAIELGGPDAISQLDILGCTRSSSGGSSSGGSCRRRSSSGCTRRARPPLEVSLAGVMLNCARGGYVDAAVASAQSGIRLTPMREFVAQQLA